MTAHMPTGWTYADLVAMPETTQRHEIIDGALVTSPTPHAWRHQRCITTLLMHIGHWNNQHQRGEVFTSPIDVVATPTKVVQPDVLFIAQEQLHIVGAYVDGAPDLVMEVVSPSNEAYDRVTKFRLYEQIGVGEYWIVDPIMQQIEVFLLVDGRYKMTGTYPMGTSAVSTLLDGLNVPVDAIFG
ncbi:MAG: Uma2 family endonuclease [Bacteroidota bacterium]